MKAVVLGKYTPHALKGVISGSDRQAAIKALMDVVGGSVESAIFTRGEYDVVVTVEIGDQVKLMGLVAAIRASGAFEKADYLEQIDLDSVVGVAGEATKVYTPAG